MGYKIGRSTKTPTKPNATLADFFSPSVDVLLPSTLYWLAVNGIATMVASNRTGTAICITLYQDKGKEPLWCNSPQEFVDTLARLNQECEDAAKADQNR